MKSAILKLQLFFSVFFILSLPVLSQKFVLDLTNENIETFLKTNKMGFLEFYSPDCPHCQSIELVYESTAQKVKEKGLGVVFGRINGDKFPEVMKKYNVEEVPTIYWFNNEKDQMTVYQGDTEMSSYFLDFIKDQMAFETPQVTFEEWNKMYEEGRIYNYTNVLIIFKSDKKKDSELDSSKFNIIANAAWKVDIKTIMWTNDKLFKKYYKINEESNPDGIFCLIFKTRFSKINMDLYEKIKFTSVDLERNSEKIPGVYHTRVEFLLKLYSKELVNIFNHENERMIVMGFPTVILAHNHELESKEYEQMLEQMSRVALKYRREVFFMYGSMRTKFTQIFTESYRLHASQFPVLGFASVSEKNPEIIEKYKRVIKLNRDKETTSIISTNYEEELTNFIEDWKNMNLQPYVSSEEIPSSPIDENGIYKLVGDTFRKEVEKPGRDVMVVLCTDRLDNCVKFKEIYSRVARKLRDNEKIVFAEINPYENELDYIRYDFIPGILFFRDKSGKSDSKADVGNGKVEQAEEYKGKLTTRDIIKFIKEKASYPITYEESLPVEEILLRNEEMNELKPMDLNQKGMVRKLHDQLVDPNQKELYKFAEKLVVARESNFLINKVDTLIKKYILENSKEVKDDNTLGETCDSQNLEEKVDL